MTACRLCGCTDMRACADGCWWVDDPAGLGPLCSACLDDAHRGLAELAEVARHPDVLEVIAAP